MQRILSLVATCAIALAPAVLTGAVLVAPALSTSGNVSTTSTATKTTTSTAVSPASVTTFGNGAPSGSHYNLNIIGVPKDKTAPLTNNDGHRIFVQLTGGEDAGSLNGKLFTLLNRVNKIFLQPAPLGESFLVLDANATDSNGALFQLPADVYKTWTVWGRALGTPGGHANMTTCATTAGPDLILGTADDEVICSLSTNTLSLERKSGKSTFTNVSADLLFITITVDPTTNAALASCLTLTATTQVTLSLFNGCLQNYFWNYDNQGLKLLQLRFYPAPVVLP